jgi:DNA-binding MarR family transcriptional regulator
LRRFRNDSASPFLCGACILAHRPPIEPAAKQPRHAAAGSSPPSRSTLLTKSRAAAEAKPALLRGFHVLVVATGGLFPNATCLRPFGPFVIFSADYECLHRAKFKFERSASELSVGEPFAAKLFRFAASPRAESAHLSNFSSAHCQGRLAVTAAESEVQRVGITCRTAADGRRAIRALAEWVQRFELAEPEFQILWCLRGGPTDGLDQTTLAKRIACSPAQVSATVERLRSRSWISQHQLPGDRRRHLWQLSAGGNQLLDKMLAAAGYLPHWETHEHAVPIADQHAREAAA